MSEKKEQSVLGLTLPHVHQAAQGQGPSVSHEQGHTFFFPPGSPS